MVKETEVCMSEINFDFLAMNFCFCSELRDHEELQKERKGVTIVQRLKDRAPEEIPEPLPFLGVIN